VSQLEISTYCGGLAATNSYLVKIKGKTILIDAPEGVFNWVLKQGAQIDYLFLTHGHWDHIWDGAQIIDHFSCPSGGHPDDAMLFQDPSVMQRFGLTEQIDPVPISESLQEGEWSWAELKSDLLHIPGHCPGSICLVLHEEKVIFGGDVLFAGAVGRWDLPGGSMEVLLDGIRKKLFPLSDDYTVYPGHGPSTTIGQERSTNPFFQKSSGLL